MLRPVSLLPALVAVATLVTWAGAATPAAAAVPEVASENPLALTISGLSAATVPRTGPLEVTGSITNDDDQTWTDINVYAVLDTNPMTTEVELTEAVVSPEDLYVGDRITDPGFATIDELEPGETTTYTVTVPHRALVQDPNGVVRDANGVYWFSVHALGSSDEGRIDGADGRARTFLPLVPRGDKSVDTAVVVPVRHSVKHRRDGSLSGLAGWERTFAQDGQLRSLVELGTAAGSRPVTWLVDPAVTDAALALVDGNPARSIEPTLSQDPDNPDPSPSDGPGPDDPSPSDGAGTDDEEDTAEEPTPAEAAAGAAAESWLTVLRSGLEGSEILSLPYGDIDVSGAADHQPGLYRSARLRSGNELEPWGLSTSPVVASPTGYLDGAAIQIAEPDTPIIVTDRMFAGQAPAVASTEDRTLVVASSGATEGGPGPGDTRSVLAVRQRIVSEAALRMLGPTQEPLVVVLPSTWSPDPVMGFFEGLDEDWMSLTTVGDLAGAQVSTPVDVDDLEVPAPQAGLELDSLDFSSAQRLIRSGDVLQNILTLNDQVGGVVRDEAFTDISYSDRRRPEDARRSADRSRVWIDRRLASVQVNGPRAVILSSGSGRFAATVANGLDQPVTVRLSAETDAPLRIRVPGDDLDLAPGARATVLLGASSSAVGIRNVLLQLTDVEGSRVGTSDEVPVRSNRVSNVIWLILGTGVALLFGAITVRLFRRIRASRS